MSDIPCRALTDGDVDALLSAGRVVGYRHDGLGCRLIGLLNTARLGRALGLPYEFLWEVGPAGDGYLHGYSDSNRTALDEVWITDVASPTRATVPSRVNLWANKPVRMRNESADAVLAELRQVARSLTLADGRQLGQTMSPDRFAVGLHVRAGDARHLRWLLTKYFPEAGWLQVLERIVDQADGTAQVYVATDSPSFLSEARRRYRGRIVSSVDGADRQRQDKVAADLEDLVLLAQCSRIVAPRMSNFSLVSALVGGVPRTTPEDVLGITAIVDDLTGVAVDTYTSDVRVVVDRLSASDPGSPTSSDGEVADVVRTLVALEKRRQGTPRIARVTRPGGS